MATREYYADGENWTVRGTPQTINMVPNTYIGLAVAGGNTAALGTAIFHNLSVTSGSTPVIASVSPTSGIVGTPVTVTGSSFRGVQGNSTLTLNRQPGGLY